MIEEKPVQWTTRITTDDLIFGRRLKKIHVIDESKVWTLEKNAWDEYTWTSEVENDPDFEAELRSDNYEQ